MFIPLLALTTAFSFYVPDYSIHQDNGIVASNVSVDDVSMTITYTYQLERRDEDLEIYTSLQYENFYTQDFCVFQFLPNDVRPNNKWNIDFIGALSERFNFRIGYRIYQQPGTTRTYVVNYCHDFLYDITTASVGGAFQNSINNNFSIYMEYYLIWYDETIYNQFMENSYNIDTIYNQGYDDGYNRGYGKGYNEGYSEAYNADTTIASISTAIMQVGVLPINLFLAIFNYEILGINISGLVGGALTIACLVIALRTILGTNKGS